MRVPGQVKGVLKVFGIIAFLILCLWGYLGCRLGVWGPVGYTHYIECVVGTSPIGFDLWHGNIKPGDSVSRLQKRVNVARTIKYGPWTELHVVPGCGNVPSDGMMLGPQTYILAKGDSMVRAGFGSCTFQREFFDSLTPDEEIQRQKAFKEFVDGKAEERESESLDPSD
jgi:hypothetical protein